MSALRGNTECDDRKYSSHTTPAGTRPARTAAANRWARRACSRSTCPRRRRRRPASAPWAASGAARSGRCRAATLRPPRASCCATCACCCSSALRRTSRWSLLVRQVLQSRLDALSLWLMIVLVDDRAGCSCYWPLPSRLTLQDITCGRRVLLQMRRCPRRGLMVPGSECAGSGLLGFRLLCYPGIQVLGCSAMPCCQAR